MVIKVCKVAVDSRQRRFEHMTTGRKKLSYPALTTRQRVFKKFFKIFLRFALYRRHISITLTPPEIDLSYGRKR